MIYGPGTRKKILHTKTSYLALSLNIGYTDKSSHHSTIWIKNCIFLNNMFTFTTYSNQKLHEKRRLREVRDCLSNQGCINCGIPVSGIRSRGEHGDVFLFSNLGALWFSENFSRYSLHVCLREIKNNFFSFKHSYLRHFSWRFSKF